MRNHGERTAPPSRACSARRSVPPSTRPSRRGVRRSRRRARARQEAASRAPPAVGTTRPRGDAGSSAAVPPRLGLDARPHLLADRPSRPEDWPTARDGGDDVDVRPRHPRGGCLLGLGPEHRMGSQPPSPPGAADPDRARVVRAGTALPLRGRERPPSRSSSAAGIRGGCASSRRFSGGVISAPRRPQGSSFGPGPLFPSGRTPPGPRSWRAMPRVEGDLVIECRSRRSTTSPWRRP